MAFALCCAGPLAANGGSDAAAEAPAASTSGNGGSSGGATGSLCCSAARLADSHEVQEFLLQADGSWRLLRSGVHIQPVSRTYAPANMRAAAQNAEYAALLQKWIEEAFTLRCVHARVGWEGGFKQANPSLWEPNRARGPALVDKGRCSGVASMQHAYRE